MKNILTYSEAHDTMQTIFNMAFNGDFAVDSNADERALNNIIASLQRYCDVYITRKAGER